MSKEWFFTVHCKNLSNGPTQPPGLHVSICFIKLLPRPTVANCLSFGLILLTRDENYLDELLGQDNQGAIRSLSSSVICNPIIIIQIYQPKTHRHPTTIMFKMTARNSWKYWSEWWLCASERLLDLLLRGSKILPFHYLHISLTLLI